jgi:predicted transcriptional regulator
MHIGNRPATHTTVGSKREYAVFNAREMEWNMAKLTRLGDLERAVMDHLWSTPEPQTVRQVHEALSVRRDLAYTTIMTVLQRLAKKNLVSQLRDDRAHRYAPVHGRDELVAGLMVDALAQAEDPGGRQAALVHFVERVGADEADALRRALAELEATQRNTTSAGVAAED